MFWRDRSVVNNKILLELKTDLEKLRIEFVSLKLEFDLIVRKLKIKYKISQQDKEPEDIKDKMFLPEPS